MILLIIEFYLKIFLNYNIFKLLENYIFLSKLYIVNLRNS